MNCAHANKLVDAFVDAELDAGTTDELARHLGQCTACSALVAQRAGTRGQVKALAPYFRAPASLRARIVAALADPSRRGERYRRRCVDISWRHAAAATLLALASGLGGYLLGRPAAPPAPLEPLIAGHVASLSANGRLTDVASSDRHTVRPWFQGKVAFAPTVRDLSADGFVLLGGRIEQLDGRPAAAIVYRLRGHFITLYVWHDAPGAGAPTQIQTARGLSVVSWSGAGLQHAAVSDLNANDLLRFAELLQNPQ